MSIKESKIKKHWWTEEHNKAFMKWTFDTTLSDYDRDKLFEDILYPVFTILARSIVQNSSWHIPMRITAEDLLFDIIAFMAEKAHTFKENGGVKGKINISSYLYFIANRYVYQKWRLAKARVNKEPISLNEETEGVQFGESVADYKLEDSINQEINAEFYELLLDWWRDNINKLRGINYIVRDYGLLIINDIANEYEIQVGNAKLPFIDIISKKHNVVRGKISRAINVIRKINRTIYKYYIKNNEIPKADYINSFITKSKIATKQRIKNTNIYTLKNITSGELFVGMPSDFYKKYNVNPGHLYQLCKGTVKTAHGWILINNEKD